MLEHLKQWLCEALDEHLTNSLTVAYKKNPATLQLEPIAYIAKTSPDYTDGIDLEAVGDFWEIRYSNGDETVGFFNEQSAIEELRRLHPKVRFSNFCRSNCP